MKKVVVITGVFGGIGYETARLFHQNGWSVVGIDRKEMKDKGNYIELFLNLDVSEPLAVKKLFEAVSNSYNRVDCLVNNAAVQVTKGICDTTEEEWDMVYSSNIKATFMCVKHAYNMLKAAGGSIINVSSVHAFATSKNISAYASTKGAILAFTRAAALEFAEEGIRVNAVLPGATDTKMLREGLERWNPGDVKIKDMLSNMGAKHPLKRIGKAEDIASAIYFLGDNTKSSFITGQSLVVDGGALAQLSTEV